MRSADLLVDAFGRVREELEAAVDGLDVDALTWRADPEANPISWLVWHASRVQDDHLADAFDRPQVWLEQGWADRFGLPFDRSSTGYGHSREEVGAVRAEAQLLLGYHRAVHARTVELLADVRDDDLDRVVDEGWDPPVTLGVRLVSVIADGLQHAGQAGFVRGLVNRAGQRPDSV